MKAGVGIGIRRRWGKGLVRLSLMLLLAALPAGAGSVEAAAPRIGSTLLPLTLLDVKGMPIRIPESVRGKVLVLHFWQIGCSSCELEMPAMDGLYSQYRRRGLEILAVNVGQKNELVQKFAVELGVSYPLLIDAQGKSAALYGATDVPRTYVTDRKGVIRYRILGGVAPETLRRLILSLL